MKTMYRAYKWGGIEKVNVVKETRSFVMTEKSGRLLKVTSYGAIFDTWGEAAEWIVKHCQSELERNKQRLEHSEKELAKAQNLKPNNNDTDTETD
jgi:hypothetical protein